MERLIACWKLITFFTIVLVITACGGSSSSSTEDAEATVTDTESVGGAMSALLDSSADSSESAALQKVFDLLVSKVYATGTLQDTCSSVTTSPSDGITVSADIVAGTYGTSTDNVTVVDTDDCADGGDYAGFVISSETLTCDDGTGATVDIEFAESHGVYQIDVINLVNKIYGEFNVTDGTTTTAVDCYIELEFDATGAQTGFDGTCEDGTGSSITQSAATCTAS